MWLATLADIGVWLKQRLNRVVVSQEMFQKPSPACLGGKNRLSKLLKEVGWPCEQGGVV